MGIATNDSHQGAQNHLGAIGVTSYFSHIFGYDSGYGAKPAAGMITAFAEKTGVDVTKIGMVGDSTHDMEAGRNAGAVTIAVRSGNDDPALGKDADHILDSIAGLPDLLDGLAKT